MEKSLYVPKRQQRAHWRPLPIQRPPFKELEDAQASGSRRERKVPVTGFAIGVKERSAGSIRRILSFLLASVVAGSPGTRDWSSNAGLVSPRGSSIPGRPIVSHGYHRFSRGGHSVTRDGPSISRRSSVTRGPIVSNERSTTRCGDYIYFCVGPLFRERTVSKRSCT